MTTTLSEGVKVPDVGSVNWAGDLEVNWNLLNGALANLSGNVKLDRDNTWTGEQTYTLPIVGSITGTASKAIADEDGTSIKTGYVNVAGNQTVAGKKTWTGSNTFNQTVTIAGQSGIWWDRTNYTAGILPSSTLYYGFQNAYESGGSIFDRIRSYVSTTGTNLSEHVKYAWNDLTKYASVTLWVSADGSDSEYKYNTVRVIPATNNAVSLGSSSYQWGSVYAQTYYYNGTAWGLDKANTWTDTNTYSKTNSDAIRLKNGRVAIGETISSDAYTQLVFQDKNTDNLAYIRNMYATDGANTLDFYVRNKYTSGSPSTTGSVVYTYFGLSLDNTGKSYARLKGDFYPYANNTYSLGISSYQWSSVYAQTYYYNGTEFSSKFVTTDTSQSISSQKTFNANLICTSSIYTRNNDYTLGTIPTSSITATNRFVDKSNADFGYVRCVAYTDGRTVAELKARNKFTNGALNQSGSSVESTLIVGIDSTGSSFLQFNGRLQNGLIPTTSESYNCGTSTNKWKTLNGINPGALSLPDFTSETGVSLSAGANTYTPVLSGWLSISTTGDISVVCGNFCHKATDMISVPVIAGKTYTVTMPASATGYFYPCLGNV